jgi:hypothetical protein
MFVEGSQMPSLRTKLIVAVAVTALTLVVRTIVLAGVDVRVEFDKAFDFKAVRTWGWNPKGPGEVRMARTQDDDPDAMRKRAEPVIVEAVTAEMKRLGLQAAAAPAAPDVSVTYYLLLTIGATSQTLGQFLPSTPEWGLPPFAPATQSLTIMNEGSLVLDLTAKDIVWRGVAHAQLKPDADPKRREAMLRESVRDLLRRYPGR